MIRDYDTSRSRRMLVLWLSLEEAVAEANVSNNGSGQHALAPWDCDDTKVQSLWNQITHPDNFYALFEWLQMAADGRQADWALKALQACQERKLSGGGSTET